MAGPSVPQRGYTTLENRLSQPGSKKARQRRRKAERQALEDARVQKFNWLNRPSPFVSGVPILPLRSWSNDVQMYGGYLAPQSTDRATAIPGLNTGFTLSFPPEPEPADFTLYDNREPHSVSPPAPPSHWVSSMAKAASDPIDLTKGEHEPSQWSPLSTHISLPPPPLPSSLPPPLPPHATNTPNNLSRPTLPKPAEHHALPPKPPPPRATIGMKPDQDPNSKHGIFQLASATKEAGTDLKKKGPVYMPNPARTLVMEQLPKTHRHPDFINNWSKSACGALPVHIFIDGPGGKALIEFATAELARKAWASPKLGPTHTHQVKGKPREDLIKVWWYRVVGVGAGSGVGEIEEGEIEGDAIEREVDQPIRKETKKEKKARLAKEREEKRVKRELELSLIKGRHASLQAEFSNSTTSSAVQENSYQRPSASVITSSPWPISESSSAALLSPSWSPTSPPWSPDPAQASNQHLPIAPDPGNWSTMEWGPSPSDGWIENHQVPSTWTGQADDLDDYECMEIDESPLVHPIFRPAVQSLPLHSSLPPRPASTIVAPHPRVAVQKAPVLPPPAKALPSSQPVCEALPPQVEPPWLQSPIIVTSESSMPSLSTPSPTSTPSEPRAMKNAPTEPSFTKRALMARQKELEERIAKSKLELAETRAAAVSITKPTTPATPASSVQSDNLVLVKPSMDLGEKQAMEDRLRKLVLKSQRERGKTGVPAVPADNNNGATNASAATTPAPNDFPSTSSSVSASSFSSSSSSPPAPSPVVLSNQLSPSKLTTVSLSAHHFSLEDLAVSFITQTINTIKSEPTPTVPQPPSVISTHPSNKSVSTSTQSNNANTKLELAAKQKRLEQHIAESKKLMTKLAQARTKEEKDAILKAMREMTRCVPISPIPIIWLSLLVTSWTK